MTDSNCTREGYDYAPRYRAPDQCPECRCAPGADHNLDSGGSMVVDAGHKVSRVGKVRA